MQPQMQQQMQPQMQPHMQPQMQPQMFEQKVKQPINVNTNEGALFPPGLSPTSNKNKNPDFSKTIITNLGKIYKKQIMIQPNAQNVFNNDKMNNLVYSNNVDNDVEEYLYNNQLNPPISCNSVMGNRNTDSSLTTMYMVDKNNNVFYPQHLNRKINNNSDCDLGLLEVSNNKSFDISRNLKYNSLLNQSGEIWKSIFDKNNPSRLIYLLNKNNNSILPYSVNDHGDTLVHMISMNHNDNPVFIFKLQEYYARLNLLSQFRESFIIKNNKGLTPLHVSAICNTVIVASNIVDTFPSTINQKDNNGKTACFMSIFLNKVDNPWIITVTDIMKYKIEEKKKLHIKYMMAS